MTEGVSLTGIGVSLPTSVSLQINTTGIAALGVNVIGNVSLSGNTTGSTPAPPSTSIYSYNFSLPRNSFYITTTAF